MPKSKIFIRHPLDQHVWDTLALQGSLKSKNGLKPMLISCSMISAGGQNDLMMLFLAIYSQLKLKFVWCVGGILHFYSTRKWHHHLYRLSSK
jgi:hypothetical protein